MSKHPVLRPVFQALAVGLLALSSMGTSCLNPCEQLAQKICSCEPTQYERDTCTREASLQQSNPSRAKTGTALNDQQLACQQFLASCECRKIKSGDIQACGLSKE